VNLTCFKLVKVAGREFSRDFGLTRDYGFVISARFVDFPAAAFLPPYDGCTLTGMYGHTWNDATGTHDAVEVPLTPRGRGYFVERAVARDIEWLARVRVFHESGTASCKSTVQKPRAALDRTSSPSRVRARRRRSESSGSGSARDDASCWSSERPLVAGSTSTCVAG
jgi:hypothetical protein